MINYKLHKDIELTLSKYVGEKNVLDVISDIRRDMQAVFDKYIDSEEGLYTDDFPIDIKNDLGKWKILQNGECWITPVTQTFYVNIDITIKPTSEA
jgi:hypothetical protein